MEEQRLIELLAKKHAEGLTLPEQSELVTFIKTEPESSISIALIEEILHSQISFEQSINPKIQKEAFAKIATIINTSVPKSGRIKKRALIKIAVTAVVFIVLAGILYLSDLLSKNTKKIQQIVSTEKGSKTKIVLPDGSQVWLNADTKLSYSPSFDAATREVTLVGEAYFDVVKDSKHPFVVHTENMDIRVLGTVFNVKSYANETTSQTTLLKGRVQVLLKNQENQEIYLSPNEKITVRNTAKNKPLHSTNNHSQLNTDTLPLFVKTDLIAADSVGYETAWKNERLVFRQESFEEIVSVLERWYNVKITVQRIPENNKFRGTFNNDNLEDVLKAFQASVGIKYKIEKDSVTIY